MTKKVYRAYMGLTREHTKKDIKEMRALSDKFMMTNNDLKRYEELWDSLHASATVLYGHNATLTEMHRTAQCYGF